MTKKRTKDSDMLQPLANGPEEVLPASLEIKEILDPEVCDSSFLLSPDLWR